MYLFALDTSGASGSIALLQDKTVLAESLWQGPSQHTSEIPIQVERLLREANLKLPQIEAFAVTTGPGSFTGLRVGLSFVKGLAWPGKRPVAGVSSLLSLAAGVGGEGLLCPLIDAKRDEVYGALFEKKGEAIAPLLEEKALSPRLFLETVRQKTEGSLRPLFFLGTGSRRYEGEIRDLFGDRFHLFNETYDSIRAGVVGQLGWGQLQKGIFSKGGIDLVPQYLRASEAEIKKSGI